MSTRTTNGRIGLIGKLLMTIVICPASAQLAFGEDHDGQVKILSFAKASDGEYIVFNVTIERPDDLSPMTIERSRWQTRRTVWPRLASLKGRPLWKYPCYLEYQLPDRWPPAPRLDRLTFICRCPAVQSLNMTLKYPIANGGSKAVPLELKLDEADMLTGEPSPRQRWAAAQAEWFNLLSEQARDVGGFWTYAAQQTRRKFDLPLNADPVRRSWRSLPLEDVQYAVFSGALAIQESLQLDRMVNANRDQGERVTAFTDIPAVSVKSHPFDEMRGDKKPVHGKLANLVPADHYFLRFRDITRLLELLDFSEQWGGSLLRLARPVGTDHGTRRRTLRQLCLSDTVFTRVLDPTVKEIAITGSDPYVVNGSDITVLFQVQAKEVFQPAVDIPFAQARQANSRARYGEVTYKGVTVERLVGPHRRISCHRCWIDDVCVYSNSLVAIQRVIDTAKGAATSLAKAPDFKYIRAAVFPLDERGEDGFLYLSDAFIRRLVGPEVRIKQKRRLEAATSLKLLTNAAMFYGYQHGPSRPTFEQLVADRSLNADDLFDPEGGVITWDADAGAARSSTFGDIGFLTPLIELDSQTATKKEVEGYGQFRDRYQQYWRRYFDPIGVRIKQAKTITLETYVLPLIDVSRYNELADIAGGEPITIHPERFGKRTLLRYVMHLREGNAKSSFSTMLGMMTRTNTTSDWLGDWVTFWVEDTDAFSTLVRREYESMDEGHDRSDSGDHLVDVFNATFVLGVHAKNKLSLAAFLVAMKTMINTTAPDTVVFRNLDPYHGVTIVQIAPDPEGPIARDLGRQERDLDADQSKDTSAVVERSPAIYYATIEDGFYLSTQASALRNLIDRIRERAQKDVSKTEGIRANVLLYVAPRAAELARPTVSYLLEQQARQVSWRNLAQVWQLGRCGLLNGRDLDEVADAYLGYSLVCPDGGTYRYDNATATATSSIHGPLRQPARLEALPPGSPLDKLLQEIELLTARTRFTEDGLATEVRISRQ